MSEKKEKNMFKKTISIVLVVISLVLMCSCSVKTTQEHTDEERNMMNGMRNYLADKYELEKEEIEILNFKYEKRAKKFDNFTLNPYSYADFIIDNKQYRVLAYQRATYDTYYGDNYEKEQISSDLKKYFLSDIKEEPVYFNVDYYSNLFKNAKETYLEDIPQGIFSCVINEKYTGDVVSFFAEHKWREHPRAKGIFLNITAGFNNAKTIKTKLDSEEANLWAGYVNILNFKNQDVIINKNFRVSENMAYIYPYLTEFCTYGDYSNNPLLSIRGYQKVKMKDNGYCYYVSLINDTYICNEQDVELNVENMISGAYDNIAGGYYYIPVKNIPNFKENGRYKVSYVQLNKDTNTAHQVSETKINLEENLKYNKEQVMIQGIAESNDDILWTLIK
jgi:hypothetical protein